MESVLERFVRDSGNQARQQLEQYGALTIQNSLWAGTPSYSTEIDDTKLATVPDFVAAGLDYATLNNAVYALEQIRTAINNALPALSVLSQV